VERKGKS